MTIHMSYIITLYVPFEVRFTHWAKDNYVRLLLLLIFLLYLFE